MRFLNLHPIVVDIIDSMTGVALIMLGCNQVRYSHHLSQKQKVIQLFDIKMLFPCIVLIIIIHKRLRMNNIYYMYLYTGVRNDENIKFPRHSPSQMTIFNAFSSKGKVATLSMTRFFFKTKKKTTFNQTNLL